MEDLKEQKNQKSSRTENPLVQKTILEHRSFRTKTFRLCDQNKNLCRTKCFLELRLSGKEDSRIISIIALFFNLFMCFNKNANVNKNINKNSGRLTFLYEIVFASKNKLHLLSCRGNQGGANTFSHIHRRLFRTISHLLTGDCLTSQRGRHFLRSHHVGQENQN